MLTYYGAYALSDETEYVSPIALLRFGKIDSLYPNYEGCALVRIVGYEAYRQSNWQFSTGE